MNRIVKSSLLSLLLALCVLALAACQSAPAVTSIEVTTQPAKTEYKLGEELTLEGGQLTVSYSDKTTQTVALTDEGVTVSTPNMQKAGRKSLTVNYGGMRCRLYVTVQPIVVSFEMNGVGTAPEALSLAEAGPIDAMDLPADPVAEGYAFDGWFTNEALSEVFSKETVISADTTLYAAWHSLEAVSCEIVFDQNYTGSAKAQTLTVESGSPVAAPAEPARTGYRFDGWFNAKDGGEAWDFNAKIAGDMTLFAHWTRTAEGVNQYLFEAEDVSLSGKAGKGYSGEAEGKGLVQREGKGSTLGVSNDRFVGYTYVNGFTLDFYIVSDMAVSDAVITARLSGEFEDFTLTPDMFEISLNGTPINYGRIEMTGVPNMAVREFQDYVIIRDAELAEGVNCIEFRVSNDVNWIGGGTVAATAPLFDCVKIDTTAVLWWDGGHKLPANNYSRK